MIKRRSKFLSLIVLVLFCFSIAVLGAVPVSFKALAKDKAISSKISKEAAVKMAVDALKKCFNFEFDIKKYQSNYQLTSNYPYSNAAIWQLYWYANINNINYNINCTLDANTGKIFSLGKDADPGVQKPQAPKYDEAKARKNAEAFIEKINPGVLKNSRQVSNLVNYNSIGNKPAYTFTYSRLIKNIPFDENTITVLCDATTGTVTNYSYRFDDTLKFPAGTASIKPQAAVETLKKELKLNPRYITYRDPKLPPEKPGVIKLVYVPEFENGSSVDAISGKLTLSSIYEQYMKKLDLNDKERADFLGKYKEAVKLGKDMDKTKAQEAMANIFKGISNSSITISPDPNNLTYQKASTGGGPNISTWSGQFTSTADPSVSGSITIDASTGELVNLFMNDGRGDSKPEIFVPKLSWGEAYKKAMDLIAKCFGSKLKEIDTSQTYYSGKFFAEGKELPPQQYFFIFQRKVNSINYLDNCIQVSISPKTGQFSNLLCNWDKALKFPKPSSSFNSENAKKIYLDKVKLSLNYITFDRGTDSDRTDKIVKLAYLFKLDNYSTANFQIYIDGLNGKLLNYLGEEITAKK